MADIQLIKILLVEDSPATCALFKGMLAQQPDFQVIGVVSSGREAIEQCKQLSPDVMVLDIGLPDMDGVQVAREIKSQGTTTPIVMLTVHDSDEHIFGALAAGANSYCLKTVTPEQLNAAVRAATGGASWLDPNIAKRVLNACTRAASDPRAEEGDALTQHEIEVMRLVARGLTNECIAAILSMSVETVKKDLRHIMGKLEVNDRTAASVRVVRERLI